MATKKPKTAPTDEELLAQFEGLGDEEQGIKRAPKASTSTRTTRTTTTTQQQSEADLLAELDNLAQERPKSRPHTPRPASTATSPAIPHQSSPKRTAAATPPPPSGSTRSSEERTGQQSRKSGESTRSFHQSFTPADSEHEPEPEKVVQSSGGGWWGGIFATATAAVKQAEALAKEIQKNEEAQKWAEQMKGNVGALRGFGSLGALLVFEYLVLIELQVVSFGQELCQPLQIYCIPLLRPFHPTNVFKSISHMTLSVTHP